MSGGWWKIEAGNARTLTVRMGVWGGGGML